MIERFQLIPYAENEGDWSGSDCWGLCELWYREMFGIDLSERGEIDAGPIGLQIGYDNSENWKLSDEPVEGDLIIMSSIVNRVKLDAGHIGIFTKGGVLHTDESTGCIFQSITNRLISRRITGYLHHEQR